MEVEECPHFEEVLALREEIDSVALEALEESVRAVSKELRFAYVQTLRGFEDLHSPLQGAYPLLRKRGSAWLEKDLASAFYPYGGFGYGRSYAFRQATPIGSLFKLIPSIAGLIQREDQGFTDLNPLTVIDSMQSGRGAKQILGYLSDGTSIRRFYKGGTLPRAHPNMGEISLTEALERSSNLYFSLLAGDVLESPNTLLDTAMAFGLGSRTGIDLPFEYKGVLPDDLLHNKSGLYAFAIGQHSLVVTPLQAAVMVSAIANGGKILKPQILKIAVGKKREKDSSESKGEVIFRYPEVLHNLDLSDEVRSALLQGMHQVIHGKKGSARLARIRRPFQDSRAVESYRRLAPCMVGKTGTAEILFKTDDGCGV